MSRRWLPIAALALWGCADRLLPVAVGDAQSFALIVHRPDGSYTAEVGALEGGLRKLDVEAFGPENKAYLYTFQLPASLLPVPIGTATVTEDPEDFDPSDLASAAFVLTDGWGAVSPKDQTLKKLRLVRTPFPDPGADLCAFDSFDAVLGTTAELKVRDTALVDAVLYVRLERRDGSPADHPVITVRAEERGSSKPEIHFEDGAAFLASVDRIWPRAAGGALIVDEDQLWVATGTPGLPLTSRGTALLSIPPHHGGVLVLIDLGDDLLLVMGDGTTFHRVRDQAVPLTPPPAAGAVMGIRTAPNTAFAISTTNGAHAFRYLRDAFFEETLDWGRSPPPTPTAVGIGADGRLIVAGFAEAAGRPVFLAQAADRPWKIYADSDPDPARVWTFTGLADRTLYGEVAGAAGIAGFGVIDLDRQRRHRCGTYDPNVSTLNRLGDHTLGLVRKYNGQIYVRVSWALQR
ncbi:MAG: hypothetical protein U1E65_18280 [Myxococcota bacterium]